MCISNILINVLLCLYIMTGIILALYWFKTDYSEAYNEAVNTGMEEKGMTCIFLLLLALFWPLKLIKKII